MLRLSLAALLMAVGIVTAASTSLAQTDALSSTDPTELFDRRIMPIFRSPKPSSCIQCHLAAVDLKNYILPSQEQTFASLRDQGLIDLAAPRDSKILSLIKMGEKDLDDAARLIHETTRRAEYEAFAGWIEACCNDPGFRDLPPLSSDQRAGPEKSDEVIRHARKSRVVDSFARNVWSQRMRCFPCHTPHEIDPSNPRHQAAIKTVGQLEQQYDEQILSRLKIFHETPEATMQYLIEKSRRPAPGELPLISLDDPARSLMVMKPMSKLPKKGDDGRFQPPAYIEPVTHLGGLKMHPDDQSYKSFMAWIEDYAHVVGDRYVSVEQLPADNWRPTQLVLKLSDAPDAWPVGLPVQLFVHGRQQHGDSWSAEPIAFTQGTVTPRRMVNGALFLLAADDSEQPVTAVARKEFASLPRGSYLIRVYADSDRRLADDPTLLLGPEEYCGQVEINKARWRAGFRHAERVSAKSLEQDAD